MTHDCRRAVKLTECHKLSATIITIISSILLINWHLRQNISSLSDQRREDRWQLYDFKKANKNVAKNVHENFTNTFVTFTGLGCMADAPPPKKKKIYIFCRLLNILNDSKSKSLPGWNETNVWTLSRGISFWHSRPPFFFPVSLFAFFGILSRTSEVELRVNKNSVIHCKLKNTFFSLFLLFTDVSLWSCIGLGRIAIPVMVYILM